MALQIEQFICHSDNFGVLIHDPESGLTASIDAPEEAPIRAALAAKGWNLSHILTTHKHGDHVEANLALKAAFGCRIIGPAGEADQVPGLDEAHGDGEAFQFAGREVRVIGTPGHTLGHIALWIPEESVVFVGDTLFSIGCGRVFEGSHAQMWQSLQALMALPDQTTIYCGHEYTKANIRFALTVDGDNPALRAWATEVDRLRVAGEPTLPVTLASEKAANPFLRAADPGLAAKLGMAGAAPVQVFSELRTRKDNA
jgi:hydroxyacylglutathione hydrolase